MSDAIAKVSLDVRANEVSIRTILTVAAATTLFPSISRQTQAEAPKAAAQGDAEPSGWTLPMPKITLPKLSMPKFSMPKIAMPTMETSPFDPLRNSARKIGDGSKKAWEGTKEIFSMGRSDNSPPPTQVASHQEPSVWQRMFGTAPKEDNAPETIGEFMSGTRLK